MTNEVGYEYPRRDGEGSDLVLSSEVLWKRDPRRPERKNSNSHRPMEAAGEQVSEEHAPPAGWSNSPL
eukprot:scaffold237304_cov28-Tisochrysis_lutea.AAC.1